MTIRWRVRMRLLAVVLMASLVGPALAAERTDKIAMAVMELRTSGNIDRAQVEGLELVLADVLSRHEGVRAVMPSEIEALLGLEARKQMMGCETDASCLAEIGGALGAAYLLRPQVAQVGGTWLIQLALIHTEDAQTLARATREVEEDTKLVRELRAAAREILKALPSPESTPVPEKDPEPETTAGAGAIAPPAAVEPGPRRSPRASDRRGQRITFWVGLGAGTLLVAGGGGVWGINRDKMKRHNDASALWQSYLDGETATPPVTSDLLSRSDTEATLAGERIGVLMMALGVGAVITGVTLGSLGGPEEAPVQASILPVPGGAHASLRLTWSGP